MTRSIKTIYNEMITEKETNAMLIGLQPNVSSYQSLLNDLTTQSKVAVWRLIFFVCAVSIWTLESLFDQHVKWINNRAKELRPGNLFWYQQIALQFQFGDALSFDGKEFVYPTIDESAQIIKLASATEVGSSVLIKVAKLDGNGLPVKLDNQWSQTTEKDAFDEYISKVKYAGLKVLTVSRNADLMKVFYHIHVDPLVIDENGSLISDPSIKPIEDAINGYITGLSFDGVFSTTELTDRIQTVDGVINPILDSCDVKYGTQMYQPAGDFYTPNAGYLQIDNSFPLSSTITYLS